MAFFSNQKAEQYRTQTIIILLNILCECPSGDLSLYYPVSRSLPLAHSIHLTAIKSRKRELYIIKCDGGHADSIAARKGRKQQQQQNDKWLICSLYLLFPNQFSYSHVCVDRWIPSAVSLENTKIQ